MNTVITALIWLALLAMAVATFICPIFWHRR